MADMAAARLLDTPQRPMQVYLADSSPSAERSHWRNEYTLLCRAAAASAQQVHVITDDPAAADLIILCGYTETGMWPIEVWRQPACRAYPGKCVRFSTGDRELAWLPGLYASLPVRYESGLFRGGVYPHVAFPGRTPARMPLPCSDGRDAPHLYSFVGAFDTDPLRRRLGKLGDERGRIVDTSKHPGRNYGQSPEVCAEYSNQYACSLVNSMFVLCPRGVGASSIRLFEVMRAGRVPVIISDDWTPPDGPDWCRCSIRVAEKDIAAIPHIVRQAEPLFPDLAGAAAAAWDAHFSAERLFGYVVDTATRCLASASAPSAWLCRARQLTTWRFLRHGLVSRFGRIERDARN
jgi:hypothetical protein